MKKKFQAHVKVGDKVQVIAGKEKGTIGTIDVVFLKTSLVYLNGIAPRTKYKKSSKDSESKKIEVPIPIHLSNVMLWDEKANQRSRIGWKFLSEKKIRYFKKSGNLIEEKK